MSVYVLIHGAWHGAFCWHKVVPLLERAGHVVKAPDLPGHGADPTPRRNVTLKAYVDRVSEILDGCAEPAILVGHSMGGVVITQAGEARPDKIAALVYLAAFLPRNGQSLGDIAGRDSESHVPSGLVVSPDGAEAAFREDAQRAAFYADCSDEDAAHARARLGPQPLEPFAAPVTISEERYGKLPRFYIHCREDRALTIGLQRALVEAVPCRTFTLATSHSPFYSDPEGLARHLLAIPGR
jgi:pimeloyl-ACP methyl ester carboxylesterase